MANNGIGGSGNWLTNLDDAIRTLTGQPLNRPGQFSDAFMNTVTNSRGSMYSGPARSPLDVGGTTSDSGLINHVRKTVKVDAYGNPIYPSTFPARPEVPFQNNTRLAGRLPSIPLNIDGATGVAASDWFSQPGTYVGSSVLPDGRMSVADLPALPKQPLSITVNGGSKPAYAPWGATSRSLAYSALNTPKAMPTDPMTIEAQRVAKDWIDNPRDFKGRDKLDAPLMAYGGESQVNPAISAVEKALLARTGPTGVGRNGYTYINGQNMGFVAEELAKRAMQGKAMAAANRTNPSPTHTVSGDNNAFQPRSVQESVRWQTGY